MQKNIVIGKGSHYQCFDKSTAFLWLQEGFFVEGKGRCKKYDSSFLRQKRADISPSLFPVVNSLKQLKKVGICHRAHHGRNEEQRSIEKVMRVCG
ncbi:MAG: hypothetical protein H9535_08245 [Ignavibacteria bacterium]|nr:hypothetical protein [Ignavibacteria bacterium]